MTSAENITAALSVMTLGVTMFAANMLFIRSANRDIYRPLMLFFLAYGFSESQTMAELFDPQRHYLLAHHIGMVIAVHCSLLLVPMFWFYVRAITATEPMPITPKDWKHFLPLAMGTVLCTILMSASVEFREQIIGDTDLVQTPPAMAFIFSWILLMMVWVVQVFAYLFVIYRRLLNYQGRLKDVFASTDNLELRWIKIVVLFPVFSMFLTMPEMFFDVSENFIIANYVFDLLAVWLLALWGLRQKPGLLDVEVVVEVEQDTDDEKYSRSALSQEQMQRIAKKVEVAMSEDNLYRNPNLTLRDLAKKVASPPNYVSQTLNGEIGKTYFDYINDWRIEAAKPMLLSGDENVTEVAMEVGFNSRSSFYKAFKRITGKTPTAYKKENS